MLAFKNKLPSNWVTNKYGQTVVDVYPVVLGGGITYDLSVGRNMSRGD